MFSDVGYPKLCERRFKGSRGHRGNSLARHGVVRMAMAGRRLTPDLRMYRSHVFDGAFPAPIQ